MTCVTGTNIITDGLVFHYDMSNTVKSWKGKPTINLKSNPDMRSGNLSYGAYCSSGPQVVTVTDFPGLNGAPKNVLQCVTAAQNCGGGNPGGMAFGNPSLTVGLSYTISYWARVISHSTLSVTFSNQNGSGDNSNFAHGKTVTTEWKKYFYTTPSLNLQKNTWYVWGNTVNATFQFADFQIEQNSFATPFVNGTRSNTEAIVDLTKNSTITANSLTYNSDGSFSFSGTTADTNCSITPGSAVSTLRGSSNITVEALAYYTSYSGGTEPYSVITCWGSPWVWLLENVSNTLRFRITAGGADVNIADTAVHPLNQWIHVVGTYNGTTKSIYVNGVLKNSSGQTGVLSSPGGTPMIGTYQGTNYCMTGDIPSVKIYNKALSAEEVKQNFEAERHKYGI